MAVGIAVAIFIGSVGIMAAATDIAGAVVANGLIVVETSVKKVQHPTGGVVKELNISDGQKVTAGEILVRLDETVANANLAAVTKNYWELQARRARLEAEREGHNAIAFPEGLRNSTDSMVRAALASEENLFRVRREAAENQRKQLKERIAQLHAEIEGLGQQLTATGQEYDLALKELEGVQQLWDQKLVSITRFTTLQRDVARLLGDKGRLTSSIAQSKGKISETELQILQIDEDNRRDVAKELSEVLSKFEEAAEKRVAAQDVADRLEIRAPQDGIVHDLNVHTRGGVIAAGDTIMLIVPNQDKLIVEARVQPQDIDQVKMHQTVVLRFPNFNQRTTPEINGSVLGIGADVSREENSGPSYFTVRIAITPQEVERLHHERLIPGMPVEVFIRTGDRSMLSYLVKPLADQAQRAFRER